MPPAVTLAQLAIELNVPQKAIQQYAHELEGGSGRIIDEKVFDDESAAQVRARFSREANSTLSWHLQPGDIVRRRDVHAAYGGQRQGGISTPARIPDILIFTDPRSGAKFGYDLHEGLREDGSYAYTGEGQSGEQTFVRGNAALRDASARGRIIRIFRTQGVHATYVGAFTTDNPPYALETIPDVTGNPRTGIIFNLLPLDARVDLLPAYGGALEPVDSLVNYASHLLPWSPPDFSDVTVTPGVTSQGEHFASREEFQLQADFGNWLADNATPPSRLPLRAGSTLVEPDLYVHKWRWIVEAKRSVARGHVRMAIGQVLDYVHIAKKTGISASPVVLLPGKPENDLVELMKDLSIIVVYRDGSGFRTVEGPFPPS